VTEHPLDLVSAARDLLTIADEGTLGLWPRASALLGRQALEMSLERFWQRHASGLERTNMRCQLLSLPTFLGDERLAARTYHAWWALTRACHHHDYELAPTHGELDGWLSEVWDLGNEIEARNVMA